MVSTGCIFISWNKHRDILDAFDDIVGVPHPDGTKLRLRAYNFVHVLRDDSSPVLCQTAGGGFLSLRVGLGWLIDNYPILIPEILEESLS